MAREPPPPATVARTNRRVLMSRRMAFAMRMAGGSSAEKCERPRGPLPLEGLEELLITAAIISDAAPQAQEAHGVQL